MKKIVVHLLAFILVLTDAVGQENSGMLHSNFMPTNSVFINPSSMLDAKTWLDVNIVSVGAFAMNNLVGLENTNMIKIARNKYDGSVVYDQSRKKYGVYNRNFVNGPSAVWSSGDHAAGLSFGVRSFTDVRNVPDFVARYIENGVRDYTDQQGIDYSIKKLRVNSIQFGEIRLSYAYTFLKRRQDMFMGGITIHKRLSVAGGAAKIDEFNFNVRDSIQASVFDLTGDLMVTPEYKIYGKGGLGIDLGFTYQKMLGSASTYYPNNPRNGCGRTPYKYKIGVSIGDIGNVKYNKDAIKYVGYDVDNFEYLNYTNTQIDETNAPEIFLNQESSPENGIIKKPHKIRLPTFISVQYDYNFWASVIYLNGTWVQGMPVTKKKFGVRRANLLAFTPRFESKYFELAIPFSLYDYTKPQLGITARIWFFTLGTDKLLSIIGNDDVYGSDIYFAIKIPFTRNPRCKNKIDNSYNPFDILKKSHPCDAYN